MATTAAETAAIPTAVPQIVTQASPRKKRRRAPTTGAADDCFTCRERGVTCDRRRPYCSQCLDVKLTCSGYKTQLTWGVGVASRGKLRGLSLPVAKSKPAVQGDKPPARKNSTNSSTSSSTKKTPQNSTSAKRTPQFQQQPTPTSNSTSAPIAYSFVGVDPNASAHSASPSQAHIEWSVQPKFVSSDVRNQPIQNDLQTGATGGSYGRSLKRQALHLDTADLQSYTPRQNMQPMTTGPALEHGGVSGRPYGSPISPHQAHQHMQYDGAHGRYGSFSSQQGRPIQANFQVSNPPQSAPIEHSRQWPNEYPSPAVASEHSSHPGTPESALPNNAMPDGLSDMSIGIAADQLLSMQQPQAYMSHNQNPFSSFSTADVIHEMDEEVDEDFLRDEQVDGSFGKGLIRMNQPFAQQERIGKTPELRYLINYYLEVLTPVIIAFDGPGNPWREHVMSLARHNEGLQHAIAALSASNLRMRREHKQNQPRLLPAGDSVHDLSVRRSSEAHARLNDEVDSTPGLSTPGAPSVRESYHKTESIRALNKQLADPARRSDDSILAILLVICLYHMCETGVARFRTQFAGVKKIMAMRDARQAPSKETQWMITFFKWFDAMAATVNDRESQFADDLTPYAAESLDWGLENLAGCDSRLFATVSKLGRLNVLSQGKPVMSHDNGMSVAAPPAFFTSPVAGPQAPHMHPDLVFDSSGWAQLSPVVTLSDPTPFDPRPQFWTEWAQVRQELSSWSFDPAYLPTPMRNAAQRRQQQAARVTENEAYSGRTTTAAAAAATTTSPHEQFADKSIADIRNISESFRHAALLYTERLAYPTLPSSAPQFQKIVRDGLHYIRLVKSDVCLLWPLFIVGTECILTEDRNMVRERCWEIQKDSGFFNNIKCLELLEVIWDKANKEAKSGNAVGPGAAWDMMGDGSTEPFKWRREMRSSDGEYIVI